MEAHARATVAFIAGRIISGKVAGSVYDFAARRHVLCSGEITPARISVYDHRRECHCSGSRTGRLVSLYDHGRRCFVSLDLDRDRFSGYDHGSQKQFSGTVTSDGSIALYDYEPGRVFQFSV